MTESMQNKVVLITGASSGIGEATARELAVRGARLMLSARREDRLESLRADLESRGAEVRYRVTDVADRRQVEALAGQTIQTFGQLDVLFNNAGLMPLSFMQKLHIDEWERMVDVNVKGVLYCIGAVLPHMLERDSGHVVNVSSVAGHIVFPGGAVYCGTKYAVRAITEGLRGDLHPRHNIRVTLISPGMVATELTDHITDPDIAAFFRKRGVEPLDPAHIARAVCWALEQPPEVDVNEILLRPVSQER